MRESIILTDCVIESGASSLDNAMLTGESMPEPVGMGSTVHAGATNLGDPLHIRITAAADDTVLAEIARVTVENISKLEAGGPFLGGTLL